MAYHLCHGCTNASCRTELAHYANSQCWHCGEMYCEDVMSEYGDEWLCADCLALEERKADRLDGRDAWEYAQEQRADQDRDDRATGDA